MKFKTIFVFFLLTIGICAELEESNSTDGEQGIQKRKMILQTSQEDDSVKNKKSMDIIDETLNEDEKVTRKSTDGEKNPKIMDKNQGTEKKSVDMTPKKKNIMEMIAKRRAALKIKSKKETEGGDEAILQTEKKRQETSEDISENLKKKMVETETVTDQRDVETKQNDGEKKRTVEPMKRKMVETELTI